MRAVIQRVSSAQVVIDNKVRGAIGTGFLVLVGICEEDSEKDVEWLAKKIVSLRVFSDKEGKMNLSLADVAGELLVVSQFTLHASTRKGNRPSFIRAAGPDKAIPLYEKFVELLRENSGVDVKTGEFGADMKITLTNDGPVTIIIDSQLLE